jgi:hypothetical protein
MPRNLLNGIKVGSVAVQLGYKSPAGAMGMGANALNNQSGSVKSFA